MPEAAPAPKEAVKEPKEVKLPQHAVPSESVLRILGEVQAPVSQAASPSKADPAKPAATLDKENPLEAAQ